jgi:O-methyltransferase
MRIKSLIESVLRVYPPAYRAGSHIYHRMKPDFRTLSPGAPAAIRNALAPPMNDADARAFSGDYYEFGLFRGGTFLAAYHSIVALELSNMHMYGFDSFEGLPAPATSIDAVDSRFFEGQFACSRSEVEHNLAEHGMDMSRATLIEGFYEESLTEALHAAHPFRPASLVFFDCDYYSSTILALRWMDRYIRPGTALIFDDWFSYGDDSELGQQKAMAEWRATRPELEVEHIEDFEANGRSFIVRRN